MLGEESNDLIRDGLLELIYFRFLAEDCDTELQIRKLDVRDHSPLKSRDQSRLNTWDFGRRAIGRHDDLTSVLVQSVEGVEKLFLRGFLSLQEVHVIDQQEITLAETPAKLVGGTSLNGVDVLVGKLFRAHVENSQRRISLQKFMRDGLHEVSLPDPCCAVDKERIVDSTRCLRDGKRGSSCNFVGFADDELIERVAS